MSKKRTSSPDDREDNVAPADRSTREIDERGEFEDRWEDEFEEEDIVSPDEEDGYDETIDGETNDGEETGMEKDMDDVNLDKRSPSPVPYLPSLQPVAPSDPKRPLVPDLSSYVFLHHANPTWPALSFDILQDNLGSFREKPPHDMTIVAGTQASSDERDADELIVMRWEGLSRIRKGEDGNSSDENDENDDDDDDVDEDPKLTHRSIPHQGPVNRVRSQPFGSSSTGPTPGSPYHVATFSETGKVHIFDIADHLAWLHDPTSVNASTLSKKPVHTITAHGGAEGFALAWAPSQGTSSTRRLLSGDIHSKIFLTELDQTGGSWTTSSDRPFASHTSSVEDISWSPTESTVFASVSADRSLRIWDTRVKDRKSVLAVEAAHESDVNVLSWNSMTSFTMATGGDEGHIKVWDLRQLQQQGKKSASGGQKKEANRGEMARLLWHQAPITSIEWNPNESSSLAASGADDQVTLWELGVEADPEESSTGGPESKVPPQLMFVHQGQRDVKELHWHKQIPGSIVTTALDGFDIFKTISF